MNIESGAVVSEGDNPGVQDDGKSLDTTRDSSGLSNRIVLEDEDELPSCILNSSFNDTLQNVRRRVLVRRRLQRPGAGIECHPRGGIVVDNNLQTSAPVVYAIGECASWKGNYYRLIAPGSMACFFDRIETDVNFIDCRNGRYPLVQFDRNGFTCAKEDVLLAFH